MVEQHGPRAIHECACSDCQRHQHSSLAQEHRRITRLVADADERTRRLLAGFLAQQHGRGGISLLALITGLDRNTVASGRRELQLLHPAILKTPKEGDA